ncbi:MAG: hypothetical protein AB2693_11605 [Candidatus Thiodiazotropha sp.]
MSPNTASSGSKPLKSILKKKSEAVEETTQPEKKLTPGLAGISNYADDIEDEEKFLYGEDDRDKAARRDSYRDSEKYNQGGTGHASVSSIRSAAQSWQPSQPAVEAPVNTVTGVVSKLINVQREYTEHVHVPQPGVQMYPEASIASQAQYPAQQSSTVSADGDLWNLLAKSVQTVQQQNQLVTGIPNLGMQAQPSVGMGQQTLLPGQPAPQYQANPSPDIQNVGNTQNETGYDPTIENILKSIGFDFDMSKRMQEKAKQTQETPLKPEEPQFGINQTASFLGGGLSHDEMKTKLLEKGQIGLDSLIREAKQNVYPQDERGIREAREKVVSDERYTEDIGRQERMDSRDRESIGSRDRDKRDYRDSTSVRNREDRDRDSIGSRERDSRSYREIEERRTSAHRSPIRQSREDSPRNSPRLGISAIEKDLSPVSAEGSPPMKFDLSPIAIRRKSGLERNRSPGWDKTLAERDRSFQSKDGRDGRRSKSPSWGRIVITAGQKSSRSPVRNRSLSPRKIHISPPRHRSPSPRRRSPSPRRRSISPRRRSLSQRRRRTRPRKRSLSPRRRSPGRPGSPRKRSRSPRRSLSPRNRRSVSPRSRKRSFSPRGKRSVSPRSRRRTPSPKQRKRGLSPRRSSSPRGKRRSISPRGRKRSYSPKGNRSRSRDRKLRRSRSRDRGRRRSGSFNRRSSSVSPIRILSKSRSLSVSSVSDDSESKTYFTSPLHGPPRPIPGEFYNHSHPPGPPPGPPPYGPPPGPPPGYPVPYGVPPGIPPPYSIPPPGGLPIPYAAPPGVAPAQYLPPQVAPPHPVQSQPHPPGTEYEMPLTLPGRMYPATLTEISREKTEYPRSRDCERSRRSKSSDRDSDKRDRRRDSRDRRDRRSRERSRDRRDKRSRERSRDRRDRRSRERQRSKEKEQRNRRSRERDDGKGRRSSESSSNKRTVLPPKAENFEIKASTISHERVVIIGGKEKEKEKSPVEKEKRSIVISDKKWSVTAEKEKLSKEREKLNKDNELRHGKIKTLVTELESLKVQQTELTKSSESKSDFASKQILAENSKLQEEIQEEIDKLQREQKQTNEAIEEILNKELKLTEKTVPPGKTEDNKRDDQKKLPEKIPEIKSVVTKSGDKAKVRHIILFFLFYKGMLFPLKTKCKI